MEQARQHVQSTSVALTLKAVNVELAKHGHKAQLANGGGYFSLWGGEAQDWLDRTASVPKPSSLTLAQWLEEFQRLSKLNQGIMRGRGGNVERLVLKKRLPKRRQASRYDGATRRLHVSTA